MFVAVGTHDTESKRVIITSSDGITWTSRTSGTPYELRGVTYANNTFVTVGSEGTILTSGDGTTWIQRTWTEHSGELVFLMGVTYSQ